MRRHSILIIPILIATHWNAGCGKEVCEDDAGPVFEVNVSFTGFDRQAATVLEFDSYIDADPPPGSEFGRWKTRRIGRIPFPSSARDGSQTFVFDPGWFIRSRPLSSVSYTLVMWLRVYDAEGRMLAEGKFKQTSKANQCHLNNSMTVSDSQFCNDKAEGDLCPQQNGTDRVCQDDGSGLQCTDSTCGDGYVDRLNGELCEAGVGDSTYLTCGTNCLPVAVDRVLTQPGASWPEVFTATVPPAREYHAGAVDTAAGELVLFGGLGAGYAVLGDTWRFDGTRWTLGATGATEPAPRFRHAMAYHAAQDVVLLFGGTDDATTTPAAVFNDLWTWDTTNGWLAQTAIGDLPPALHSTAMAYDPIKEEVVMHGGISATGTSNQTFVLKYTSGDWVWEDQSTSPAPSPGGRFAHTMTYLPNIDAPVLVGGLTTVSGTVKRDVWRFVSGAPGTAAWHEISASIQLTRASRHQLIPIPSTESAVVFGGTNGPLEGAGVTQTTWTWDFSTWQTDGGSWDSAELTNVPVALSGQLGFALPGTGAYLFGGRVPAADGAASHTLSNRTWVYHPSPDTAHSMGLPRLWMRNENETTTPGYYAMTAGDATSARPNRVSTLQVGDFDGDGWNELAIGLPGGEYNTAQVEPAYGKVYAMSTPLQGGDTGIGTLTDTWMTLVGPDVAKTPSWGSWFGAAMAAGDINGDGAEDLVIGAPGRNDGGAAYILFGGSTTALSSLSRMPPEGRADALRFESVGDADNHVMFGAETLTGDTRPEADRFGYAVAVGDFDGDGLMDVAMGAPLRSDGESEAGAVYIVPGDSNMEHYSLGTANAAVNQGHAGLSLVTLRSNTAGQRIGVALATGDINGDGYADLVVGSSPTSGSGCIPPACGALAVLWGGRSFFDQTEVVFDSLEAPAGALAQANEGEPVAGLGARVTTVDLDQDGYAEVVSTLMNPNEPLGTPDAVVLFRGSSFEDTFSTGASAGSGTYLMITGPAGLASGFGLHLGRGDVNGDRRADLLIGAPFEPWVRSDLTYPGTVGYRNAGALHVLFSSRRSTPWSVPGNSISVADLRALGDTDTVPIPMYTARGGFADGYFGTSAATISHLEQEDNVVPPYSYTLVVEPGWYQPTSRDKRWRGQVYTIKVQEDLPCGTQDTCPTVHP